MMERMKNMLPLRSRETSTVVCVEVNSWHSDYACKQKCCQFINTVYDCDNI